MRMLGEITISKAKVDKPKIIMLKSQIMTISTIDKMIDTPGKIF